MLLRILQSPGIDHIELNMVTIETEIAADQRCQIVIAVLIFKKGGENF